MLSASECGICGLCSSVRKCFYTRDSLTRKYEAGEPELLLASQPALKTRPNDSVQYRILDPGDLSTAFPCMYRWRTFFYIGIISFVVTYGLQILWEYLAEEINYECRWLTCIHVLKWENKSGKEWKSVPVGVECPWSVFPIVIVCWIPMWWALVFLFSHRKVEVTAEEMRAEACEDRDRKGKHRESFQSLASASNGGAIATVGGGMAFGTGTGAGDFEARTTMMTTIANVGMAADNGTRTRPAPSIMQSIGFA
jgi:hypothetical protein